MLTRTIRRRRRVSFRVARRIVTFGTSTEDDIRCLRSRRRRVGHRIVSPHRSIEDGNCYDGLDGFIVINSIVININNDMNGNDNMNGNYGTTSNNNDRSSSD